jgi:transcription antitermination factor NusA-like protein
VARGVELDGDSRTAHISVAPDQLSLAIGRGGENARLAARLTGWRIDIHGDDPGEDPEGESREAPYGDPGEAQSGDG